MLAQEKSKTEPHKFQIDDLEVGKRIRALRTNKDMTQGDLAKLVGRSRPAIAQWENGEATPSLSNLLALAFYLNSTPQFIAFGVASSNSDAHHIPVMDYTTPEGKPVGEMSLDTEFYRSLRRQPSSVLRAFHLPRNDMVEGMERGSVVIIDQADRSIVGAGEAFLIHHKVPAVAFINAVPGKENTYSLRIGGQHIQTDGAIPIIGRVIATMKSAL